MLTIHSEIASVCVVRCTSVLKQRSVVVAVARLFSCGMNTKISMSHFLTEFTLANHSAIPTMYTGINKSEQRQWSDMLLLPLQQECLEPSLVLWIVSVHSAQLWQSWMTPWVFVSFLLFAVVRTQPLIRKRWFSFCLLMQKKTFEKSLVNLDIKFNGWFSMAFI